MPARALRKGGACGGGPLPPEPLVPPAQVLSTLGTADQRSSEGMYEVLYDVLRRADTGINLSRLCLHLRVRAHHHHHLPCFERFRWSVACFVYFRIFVFSIFYIFRSPHILPPYIYFSPTDTEF